jgi:hypothetical protein
MRTDFSFNWPASVVIPGLRAFVLLAVVAIALCGTRRSQAQDSISIKDPAEFNAYQLANRQTDARIKTVQLEEFLRAHPQSAVKGAVLETLIDAYEGMNDADHALSAASRLLEVDPGNIKALFVSVFIKKGQCLKNVDQSTARSTDTRACDDAARLARKGLELPKPEGTSDDDWKKLTAGVYPVFHSAIALDDAFSKRNPKNAVAEYTTELMLYSEDETKSVGLWDTLLLASTYARPEVNDLVKSIWFYARVADFAPDSYKDSVEKQLEFYYKRYHGNLRGLDEIKSLAEATVFPPEFLVISPSITTGGMPAYPRMHPAPARGQSPAFLIPEAAALTLPTHPAPEVSIWPANEKPVVAAITWDSHGLYINASNSSLHQILKDVGTVTGATVEGLDADERIFGVYGPGKARDVLSQLLHGTSYNVLMIGDQGEGTPRDIVLSSRHAGATGTTVAANPTPASDDDTDADDQPQQQPPPPNRAGFGPGGQRTPQQLQELQQRQQQMQRLQQGQQQPQQPANPQ